MTRQHISNWFSNGKSYRDGLALYLQLEKPNVNIIRFLQGKENKARHQKMEYELRKAFKQLPVGSANSKSVSAIVSVGKIAPAIPPTGAISKADSFPKELNHIKQRLQKAFRLRSYHHAQLSVLGTDEERYKAACIVLQQDAIIDECLDLIEQAKRGELKPETLKAAKMTDVEALKRKSNLGTYISNYNRKIKKNPEHKLADGWREKVKNFNQEFSMLKAIIDGKS